MKLSNLLKIFVCTLFVCCFSAQLKAQNATFAWAKQFVTSNSNSSGTAIALDAAGNVYTVGFFFATGDFDPSAASAPLISAGSKDIYVSKLDANGNYVWAQKFGGTGADEALAIALDATGNIYITGSYSGTATFGATTLTAEGSTDVFVAKLNSTGNVTWAKSMGGPSNDLSYSIALDPSGNVYTTGEFRGTADFDPSATVFALTTNAVTTGGKDVFISKLNSSGDFVWAKQIGGTAADIGFGIKTDATGNVYTVGSFSGTVDFDPGSAVANFASSGGTDIFILKLNAAGDYVWNKQIGSSSADAASAITLDAAGNIYVTGSFSAVADFNPGAGVVNITPLGYVDIFVSKFNAAGDYVWAKNMGGSSAYTYAIDVDGSGNVYTTGNFNNTADFDPGPGTWQFTAVPGKLDIVISKLDASGNFVWAKQFIGDYFHEHGKGIKVDAQNNVYTTGYQNYSTTDFDPGPGVFNLLADGSTSFVHKMAQVVCLPTSSALTASACGSYTLNSQSYTASGTYTQTLVNAGGCDSTVTLTLTINTPSANTINHNSCGNYTYNSQTYTTSGIYTHVLTNAAGCDSTITLNLTINNATTASVSHVHCGPYTLNGQTYATSGTYTQTLLNSHGCDSTLTLNLTVNNASTAAVSQVNCGPYTLNGETYTTSGTYTQTLVNSNGCDSVLTLTLTVNGPSNTTVNHENCGAYSLNGQSYTASGTYTQSFTNAAGCDSTITLNLIITDINVSTTLNNATITANQNGASYQWINCEGNTLIAGANAQGYTATANGNYAVVLTLADCKDTSACVAVIGVVGLPKLNIGADIHIYPNPTNGLVHITSKAILTKGHLRIVNILGQEVVAPISITGQSFNVDVRHLPANIYFIEVQAEEGLAKFKLVKR